MLRSSLRRRSWMVALPFGTAALVALFISLRAPTTQVVDGSDLGGFETAGSAGLRVLVDEEHGGIVPLGAAELGELSEDFRQKLSRSADGLEIVEHEGGMRSVDLQGRFQSVSVLRIHPDGHKQLECLESAEDVEQFISVTSASASDREVR